MKYLVTLYADESAWGDMTPEEGAAQMKAYEEFGRDAEAAGVMVGGEGLQPTATATTLRVRDGERILTDGPFAETKEQLGGYYLLECKDLDEAIEWTAKIPNTNVGSSEIRPVMDYEAYGAESADHSAAAQG